MSMVRHSYFLLLLLLFSCSNGSNNIRIIRDDKENTKTEIETISSGTGGGITGSGPSLIKTKIRKYDSLNQLIYESYKETSFNGCLANTEKWKVIAKVPSENTKELELTKDGMIIITYKNNNGRIDSTKTVSHKDVHKIEWIVFEDW